MVNCKRDAVKEPVIHKTHRSEEILNALGIVFYNKCYLCEKKLSHPSLFEVDHFIPQKERPDLKLSWSNLYLCCKACNGSRKKTTPNGGYLDPCASTDDVEQEIVYKLPPYEFNEPLFSPRDSKANAKVLNTIKQLKRMHYGGTAVTKNKCASLRETIAKQGMKLLTLLHEKKNATRDGNHQVANEKSQLIDNMLDVSAPFTMLMRDIASRYR